jgi:ADP-ribosyl-[dinitrogen reductase] hydrolase
MEDPPGKIDPLLLDRIQGSIIGMALGDALGAHVEFRPYQFLQEKDNRVTDLQGGGTWGLEKGQVFLFYLTLQLSNLRYSFIKNFLF